MLAPWLLPWQRPQPPQPPRVVPPPEPEEAALLAQYAPTSYGSTRRQAGGRLPEWPARWEQAYPLDPVVFGPSPERCGQPATDR